MRTGQPIEKHRRRQVNAAVLAVLMLLLLGTFSGAKQTSGQAQRVFHFQSEGVVFRADFSAAAVADCSFLGASEYRVVIRPENEPINNSPWYAFQVTSEQPRAITVRLAYEGGTHRYRPKTSTNGRDWTLLSEDACRVDRKGCEAVLRLQVGPQSLWVAAQELVAGETLAQWMDSHTQLPSAVKREIGRSLQNRPIDLLEFGNRDSRRFVFILGRQHPPEVTGSLGLMQFVDTLAGDSELAARFQREFFVCVVPLANPDGVEAGHWRHNLGGVDLNRDWQGFRQPETKAIRDKILRLSQEQGRLYLFLDFHSTNQDIFYTQPDDAVTFPRDFARNWLDAIQARFPDYRVRREGTSHGGKPTSMRWVYRTFGVAAITYEWGDKTERDRIAKIASGAAEEMMRLVLDEVALERVSATRNQSRLRPPIRYSSSVFYARAK
ncbi:MAG: peptidase M14 [Rhodopirellula sp.]|nr:peptidase M14 [Rhodopirellula sp.]